MAASGRTACRRAAEETAADFLSRIVSVITNNTERLLGAGEKGVSFYAECFGQSIREYKKPSLLAPLLVSGEVVMECIIPFVTANLVNQIKAGCSIGVIVQYGAVLVVMAGLSLTFGALAGSACATASCGFARNLRKDMFYKIQDYSFENIDKFSVSSLVTRMTTDVTNVQMAYMMIVRTAIRCPLMLVFSFAMAFIMGGKMAVIFLLVIPVLGVGLALVVRSTMPLFKRVFKNTMH